MTNLKILTYKYTVHVHSMNSIQWCIEQLQELEHLKQAIVLSKKNLSNSEIPKTTALKGGTYVLTAHRDRFLQTLDNFLKRPWNTYHKCLDEACAQLIDHGKIEYPLENESRKLVSEHDEDYMEMCYIIDNERLLEENKMLKEENEKLRTMLQQQNLKF